MPKNPKETKNSSNSSKGFGNTKQTLKRQISPAKHWEFTLNNYSKADILAIEHLDSSIVPVIVGQSEVGEENGVKHLQVQLSFSKKTRPISIIKKALGHSRCSFRKVRNLTKCRDYCSKDSTHDKVWRMSRGWKRPVPLAKITYDILNEYQKSIADFFLKPCNPRFSRDIHWFWEPDGNMGKTILSTFFYDQRDAAIISGKKADCFFAIHSYLVTHDGAGPKIVIIDIPRSNIDYVSYTAIEKIKDGLLFSGKYESKSVRFNRPHIICFANEVPNTTTMSVDRWKIVRYGSTARYEGLAEPTVGGGSFPQPDCLIPPDKSWG